MTYYSDAIGQIETNLVWINILKKFTNDKQIHDELHNMRTYHEIWFDDLVHALEFNESSAIGFECIDASLGEFTTRLVGLDGSLDL